MVDNVRSVLNFQDANEHSLGPINSPRSLEACLRKGYDPDELQPKTLKSLYRPGLGAEMQQLKYEHFEQRRQEKIKVVKAERQQIIEYLTGLQAVEEVMASPQSKRNVKETVLGQPPFPESEFQTKADEMKSAMMDLEIKRIEAVKRRQQKELGRMVESEQRLSELQAKILRGEAEEENRKREHEKHVGELRAEQMSKKRERDMEKKQKEEQEIQQRRIIAEKEAEREMKIVEEEKVEARRRALQAMERDHERVAKMAEHRKKSERALLEQEMLAEANQSKMVEREEKLKEQLEHSKELKRRETMEARANAEKRIAAALQKNIKAQEEKRSAYDARQEEAATRAQEKAAELEEVVTKQADERKSKQDNRKERLDDANLRRSDRRDRIIADRTRREQYYTVVSDNRERMLSLKKLDSELAKEDRIQNVARIKRIDDFLRLQTLQKIQEDDARSERIRREKEMLVDQRKDTAHEAFLRKQRVREAMESMRVTNKFVNLDSIIDGGAKGKKKKKKALTASESAPAL